MANTQTKEKTDTATQQRETGESKGQLSTQFRIPYHRELYEVYGVKPGDWLTLIDAIFPSAKTYEGIKLALSYCRARGLDIMKKPCHVVPIWNSKLRREVESVWPSITEVRITAHRTGEYAGCDETEFGAEMTKEFEGGQKDGQDGYKTVKKSVTFPSWARVTVYRIVQGQRVAFPGPRITYLGNYGRIGGTQLPNEKWTKTPEYMLEKVAEASALRKAFPECDQGPTSEEMEGKHVDYDGGIVIDNEPPKAAAKPKPTREGVEKMRKEDAQREAAYRQQLAEDAGADPETGEIAQDDGQSASQPEPEAKSQPAKAKAADKKVDWETEFRALHRGLVDAGADQGAFEEWRDVNKERIAALETGDPDAYKRLDAAIDQKAHYFETR